MLEIISEFSRFSESFLAISLVPTNHHSVHGDYLGVMIRSMLFNYVIKSLCISSLKLAEVTNKIYKIEVSM